MNVIKRILNIRSLVLSILVMTSCSLSDSTSSPIVSSETDETSAIILGSEVITTQDFSTCIYDVTTDVLDQFKSQSGSSARAISDIVTGELSGSAQIEASLESTTETGFISLNNFLSRQGFPTLDTGILNFDFTVDETSVKGTISTSELTVNDTVMTLNITYDLYLQNELWRGTMTGSVLVDGQEYTIEYDYDSPIFSSLEAVILDSEGNESSDTSLSEGGSVRLKLGVNSNAPVNWANLMWDSPETNLTGGGSSVTFTEESKGYWVYSEDFPISQYQPSGTYSWVYSVKNAAELQSADKTITVNVTNSTNGTAPVIDSVSLSSNGLNTGNGGSVFLDIVVDSVSPANWLNLSLEGPSQYEFGGGSAVTFVDQGNSKYSYQFNWDFTQWTENGTYTFSNLSVMNEANLTSETYSNITFAISGNAVADTPVISSIQTLLYSSNPLTDGVDINGSTLSVSQDSLGSQLNLALVVISTSNAPVNWSNETFDGPIQNLIGGGGSRVSEKIGTDSWRTIIYFNVDSPEYAPKGEYSWSGISVKNEGGKRSADWSGSLNFTLAD